MIKQYVQKRPQIAFTMLATGLNRLIDQGTSLSIDDALKMCEECTLIAWIERNNVDISPWDEESKTIMTFAFQAYAACYGDCGFKNNGISYLIDMALTFVNNPPQYTLEECVVY